MSDAILNNDELSVRPITAFIAHVLRLFFNCVCIGTEFRDTVCDVCPAGSYSDGTFCKLHTK